MAITKKDAEKFVSGLWKRAGKTQASRQKVFFTEGGYLRKGLFKIGLTSGGWKGAWRGYLLYIAVYPHKKKSDAWVKVGKNKAKAVAQAKKLVASMRDYLFKEGGDIEVTKKEANEAVKFITTIRSK